MAKSCSLLRFESGGITIRVCRRGVKERYFAFSKKIEVIHRRRIDITNSFKFLQSSCEPYFP